MEAASVRHAISVALTGAAGLCSALVASAQPAPGSVFVRVVGTVRTMSMSDLDGYLADNLGTLLAPGVQPEITDDLGTTGGGGGEIGYMLDRRWSLGLSVAGNSSNSTAFFGSLLFDLGTNSLDAQITEVTASASFWAPRVRGLFAGAEAGAGFGRLDESFAYVDLGGNRLDYEGHWKGTGFVSGVFAGYQHRFRSGLLALARTGYKFRDLGVLPGHRTITESSYSGYPTGTTEGPIRDSSGRALRSDFSMFYLGLGLGWVFGGP
jgi:hypothetical protein